MKPFSIEVLYNLFLLIAYDMPLVVTFPLSGIEVLSTNNPMSPKCYRYDPRFDTWTVICPLQHARYAIFVDTWLWGETFLVKVFVYCNILVPVTIHQIDFIFNTHHRDTFYMYFVKIYYFMNCHLKLFWHSHLFQNVGSFEGIGKGY